MKETCLAAEFGQSQWLQLERDIQLARADLQVLQYIHVLELNAAHHTGQNTN